MKRIVAMGALVAHLTGCSAADPAVDVAVEVVDTGVDVASDVVTYPLEDHDDAPPPR